MNFCRSRLIAGALLLTAVHGSHAGSSSSRAPLALENVSVIDVLHGAKSAPRTVLVVAGKIAAITAPGAARIPHDALTLDGRGLFLAPGLVDMHVHLFNNFSHRPPNEWAFPLFIANGVTGVREMRTEPAQLTTVARWRAEVEHGARFAPRVLAAGVAVDGRTPAAAARKVRAATAAGADFIKVFSDVPAANWRAIMAEARRVGIDVCGHVPAQVSLLTAARAGQRTDEHLTQVPEACSPNEQAIIAARQGLPRAAVAQRQDAQEREVLASYEPSRCDRVAQALAAAGQVQVPTLVLPKAEASSDRKNFRRDPRWNSLREDEEARWQRILENEKSDRRLAVKRWEITRKIMRALHAARVPVLAGTDTPMPLVYPGSSLHEELELLVDCGFSPAEALRAATIEPAKFLGLAQSMGTVEVGKRADLILLAADPLRDVRNLRQIRAVVLAGRLLRAPGFAPAVPRLP